MKRLIALLFCLLALSFICACGAKETADTTSPTAQPDAQNPESSPAPGTDPDETQQPDDPDSAVEQYTGPRNPLTGLPVEEDISAKRPYAIMLNNLREALPQHSISKADIIYEVLAEGGITRMVGVFQDISDVGIIGSVRSTRAYYLDIAQGHDAILIHAGGSEQAYSEISARGVTDVDGVRGDYYGLFYRDQARMQSAGTEHSLFTSSDLIKEHVLTRDLRFGHSEDYEYIMSFSDDGTPAGGMNAGNIVIEYSPYKTGMFEYDAQTGQYLVSEYGQPYIDGNTQEQIGVTNVLILQAPTRNIPGDTAGRLEVDLVGEGSGYFACGGKYIEIVWHKAGYTSPFTYTLPDGSELILGRGTSYINIVPDSVIPMFE